MRKWTKTAGLIFLAAASVYSYQAIEAASGSGAAAPTSTASNRVALAPWPSAEKLMAAPADASTDVKLLDEATDPFASGPTTAPAAGATSQPAVAGAAPTSQPSEGRSVSNSEVSVSDAGTVEIHVNDANLVEVLRMLSLQSQKNIIASKDVHGTITANLYDVTVREALDAILHANGYAYREKGNFIYVYTTKEIEDIEKSERRMKTEVFRVFYTPAADAAIMIKPVLSPGGGQVAVTAPAKVGIASAPTGGGGDSFSNNDVLVVTDYPENIDEVRKLLADLDKRPQQILLEATILRADLNDDNAMGVDFNILGGADFTKVFNTSGQLVDAAANPATVNGNAHSVGTGNSFSSPINGGFKVGYVSDSISVFLSALEQVTDTTVLANPKVLALNKQQGEVFVGNEDGYYTTLTTETTTSQSVESLKTGTRLIFRPFIANDGYIRMEVHPEDSDGAVKANGLPSKSTTEVTSNVMIKDGHTIVIGGLFRESTIISKSQVPVLGNLPGAGLLFRNQKDSTKREEVIILLTPHIIKDDASYSRLSEEELKRTNDLRVGMRRGMMPWGRERLAEGWYDAAKREMAKPKPNRSAAKFDLDCATNLNPKFYEAIQLKEEITGHEVTAVDNSSVRSFVRRSIVSDVEPSTMPAHTAMDDAGAIPSTQPTASAPTSQPAVATDSTSTWGDDQKTDLSDSAATEQAMTEATSRSPETAQKPAAALPESAEASVGEESVAIPSSQPATKGGATLLNEEPTTAPAKESDSTQVITDPLAAPATQPVGQSAEQSHATVVTPLEDEVPGQIPAAPAAETPTAETTETSK
jgi:type IV pilus assembly protein PilQ